MSKKLLHAFLAFSMATCMLTSCHSDLNLSEVDTSMEAHLRMALPVGAVTMQFGNLLNLDKTTTLSFDSVGNMGVLCFKLTTDPDTTRKFSFFNMNNKIQGTNFSVNVYDQLKDKKYHVYLPEYGIDEWVPFIAAAEYGFDTLYIPETVHFDSTMTFELALHLDSINRPGQDNRVDSVAFNIAEFGFSIDKDNFDYLTTEWIDEIAIELGDEFDLHGESKKADIYSRTWGDPLYFGQQLNVTLKDWALKLLTNETTHPTINDVTDTIHVKATIKYHVPSGTKIFIDKTSGIKCNVNVGQLQPTYLWGWFKPSKHMYDEGEFPLNIDFKDLPFLSDESTVLPFSRPELYARLCTQVAGAVRLDSSYVYARDGKGVKHQAKFPNATTGELDTLFSHIFGKDECLDPTTMKTANDTTNLHITFDREFGHIQDLFEGGIPKKVNYKFQFSFDEAQTPQIRIPLNTFVNLYTQAKLPFTFQNGFYLKYENNAQNIDISQFDIDSLLGSTVQLSDTSKVGVLMKTESTIPLHVKLVLRCYDDRDSVIMDPEDNTREFAIFDKDTLDIYPPSVEQNLTTDTWTITPQQIINEAHLTKKQLGVFPKTKALRYKMIIDESCMEETFKNGVYDVPISADATIKFTIGLTADLDAAIKLNLNQL